MIKRKLIVPSPEEDAAINAGIGADPDTYELSKTELKQLKPVRSRGRPFGSGKKVQVTLRVDTDIVEAFKHTGDGWQTRMNDALKDWLTSHQA